jgi:molybdopterin-containing oxidoreductase family membrane subunit
MELNETTALLGGHPTFESVTARIQATVEHETWRWWIGVGIGAAGSACLLIGVTYLLIRGVGIWGITIPAAWGFAIVNFVWWIGIGHAGTFISAFLLLMRQPWRNSINRFAEAMTLFAVMCAGLFPLLHLGRPWFFYWLLPVPDTMGLWPQFRSPLVWDVFAVSTYFTVSLLFWYAGLLPDLATLRDRASSPIARRIYGFFSLGWRGSASEWWSYQSAYLLLAGLAAPLVISVHSVVSFDFTIAIVPGWHSTIFPPYFVAGAIFSGFAMVLTIAVPLRAFLGFRDFLTLRHLENCAKLMLATGLIVDYGYLQEAFAAWYGGDRYEIFTALDRIRGAYSPIFWLLIFCNVAVPQALWSQRVRRNPLALLLASILINVGMWSERFVIVVQSLTKDYMPSAWRLYHPTFWDWFILGGSMGFFILAFFLFVRLLPSIPMSEIRELIHEGAA